MYFQQAAYGVPIRMALISLLLSLRADRNLQKFEGGFDSLKEPLYSHPLSLGIRCANKNCISHEPMEAQYVGNKFHVVKNGSTRLRCFYCENDVENFVVGHRKNLWFADDTSLLSRPSEPGFKDLVAFATAEDAIAAGYHPKQASPKRVSS
jgi:hypothetical protein